MEKFHFLCWADPHIWHAQDPLVRRLSHWLGHDVNLVRAGAAHALAQLASIRWWRPSKEWCIIIIITYLLISPSLLLLSWMSCHFHSYFFAAKRKGTITWYSTVHHTVRDQSCLILKGWMSDVLWKSPGNLRKIMAGWMTQGWWLTLLQNSIPSGND